MGYEVEEGNESCLRSQHPKRPSPHFKVCYAQDVTEALGTLPSIAESAAQDPDVTAMDEKAALKLFGDAVGGRPLRVIDRSRLRFVLYRNGPSRTISSKALKLLPTHPQHIDAFAAFFHNYSKSRLIIRHVTLMLKKGVLHDYVQGELWLIASRQSRPDELRALLPVALHRQSATSSHSRCNGRYASSFFVPEGWPLFQRARTQACAVQEPLYPIAAGPVFWRRLRGTGECLRRQRRRSMTKTAESTARRNEIPYARYSPNLPPSLKNRTKSPKSP